MFERLKLPVLLIIADNPSVRFWIKKNLEDQFFILEAHTASSALEAVKNSPIDCIILDSRFEESDPFSLCKAIRTSLHNQYTPLLLITGKLKKSFRDEALEAGATDFISDQLDLEEIETRIAIGKKTTSIRQKTSELSTAFQKTKQSASSELLKEKFLLHDQILRALSRAQKEKIPVALLVIRPDGFSNPPPREVIESLSHFICDLLRSEDLLVPSTEGRILILLHDMKSAESRLFAEKLKKEVAAHSFPIKEASSRLTISLALSTFDGTENSFNRMVSAAIKALHQTQSMKNLIISLDPSSEEKESL